MYGGVRFMTIYQGILTTLGGFALWAAIILLVLPGVSG